MPSQKKIALIVKATNMKDMKYANWNEWLLFIKLFFFFFAKMICFFQNSDRNIEHLVHLEVICFISFLNIFSLSLQGIQRIFSQDYLVPIGCHWQRLHSSQTFYSKPFKRTLKHSQKWIRWQFVQIIKLIIITWF